jgi:hypothetical protein
VAQDWGNALDHLTAPPLFGLPLQHFVPNLPVQQHEFAVHRQGRSHSGLPNLIFELAQQLFIFWALGRQ